MISKSESNASEFVWTVPLTSKFPLGNNVPILSANVRTYF